MHSITQQNKTSSAYQGILTVLSVWLTTLTSQALVMFWCRISADVFVRHVIGFDRADCCAYMFITDKQQRIVTVKRHDQNHSGFPTTHDHPHNKYVAITRRDKN